MNPEPPPPEPRDEAGEAIRDDLVDRRDVVADRLELRPQLAQEMDEIVGEAVVVIDDEDHGLASRRDARPRQAGAALKRILTRRD